jgi:hypothetical protein
MCLFHWEYVLTSLTLLLNDDGDIKDIEPLNNGKWPYSSNKDRFGEDTGGSPVLRPPHLSEGGRWFLERVASLRKAATNFQDPEKIPQEGL